MTFLSSSSVHGPLVIDGSRKRSQRCWHWASVRPFPTYCEIRDQLVTPLWLLIYSFNRSSYEANDHQERFSYSFTSSLVHFLYDFFLDEEIFFIIKEFSSPSDSSSVKLFRLELVLNIKKKFPSVITKSSNLTVLLSF